MKNENGKKINKIKWIMKEGKEKWKRKYNKELTKMNKAGKSWKKRNTKKPVMEF